MTSLDRTPLLVLLSAITLMISVACDDIPESVSMMSEDPGRASPADAEIRAVASDALPVWLDRIPPGLEPRYGFENRQQFNKATIGNPLNVVILFAGRLESGQSNWSESLPQWRVPIIVEGRCRALLTVIREAGALRAVELGAAVLSRRIEAAEKTFRSEGANGPLVLLRSPERRMDILGALSVDASMNGGRFRLLSRDGMESPVSAKVMTHRDLSVFLKRDHLPVTP